MAVRPIDAVHLLEELKQIANGMGRISTHISDMVKVMTRCVERQPTLTPPNEPERAGLYGKYTVYKNKDGSLVTDCFILRPAKDLAAVAALRAYADSTDNAELAADIINWVGGKPNEPLTMEQLREMDNQPVWVVPMGKYAGSEPSWCVLDMDSRYAGRDACAYIPGCDHWAWPLNEYGTGWLAYYLPPEIQDVHKFLMEALKWQGQLMRIKSSIMTTSKALK